MPVRKVSKTCYKYGTSGKKYCGSGAKKKATKQGQAIAILKSQRKK